MKQLKLLRVFGKGLFLNLFITFLSGVLYAQTPQDLPKPSDNEPIDLTSPFSIIFFIVVPVLAIITYIILKRRQKKK